MTELYVPAYDYLHWEIRTSVTANRIDLVR